MVLGWRERVGLLLLQLFPNGGDTDIVFVTLFCIAGGTAIAWCGGRCAMPDGHCLNILFFWRRSTAALVFRVGACFEVSLLSPFSHSSPSLIGLLASVDVKQQKLTPSATVVASVRSTGGTVAGSVNATGFWHWQRQTRPPSFLLLLSRKMDLAIPL